MKETLVQVVVGLPRKDAANKTQLTLIAYLNKNIAITKSYKWVHGKTLFITTTHHLRKLLYAGNVIPHANIAKWSHLVPNGIESRRLWKKMWWPYIFWEGMLSRMENYVPCSCFKRTTLALPPRFG